MNTTWEAKEIRGAHKWEVTAQTSDTTWEVIALVYACIADDGDESKVERRARLIAVAPELVEALEDVASGCTIPKERLQRLLAKAKGEA